MDNGMMLAVIYGLSVVAAYLIGEHVTGKRMRVDRDRAYVDGYSNAVQRLRDQPLLRIELLGSGTVVQKERSVQDGENEKSLSTQGGMDDDRGRSIEDQGVRTASRWNKEDDVRGS